MHRSVRPLKVSITVLSLLLFAVSSCKKEGAPWWDADFSGPIAKSSLTIGNLLPDSVLLSDPDSALRVVYNETVFNYAVDSLVSIPDTTLPESNYYMPLASYAVNPGDPLFSTPATENFINVENVSLTYAIIKSGTVKLEAQNTSSQPFEFIYQLQKSQMAGSMFSITEEVPAGTLANPGTITKYYSLSGLSADFTGINSDKYNTIVTQQFVNISQTASGGFINQGEGLKVKVTFMDIVPLYAKGFLGSDSIALGPESYAFDFLKGLHADYFALQDATVNMKVTNGFGVDMSVSNVQLTSYNSFKNTSVVLSGSGVQNNYNINRAQYTSSPSPPVIETTKNFALNSTNSNIKSFIENLPDQLIYDADVEINPLGNVSGNNDFVHYGYGFRTDLQMEIPLAFAATNLQLQDTVELDMHELAEAENVNHGELTLRATNGFPFDAAVQAYILDENNSVTDSLFASPNLIGAGYTDANFKVTAPKLSFLTIPVHHDLIHKLRDGKNLVFKIVMNTVSQQPTVQIVKIYDYYKMDLVLTGDLNYSVNKK